MLVSILTPCGIEHDQIYRGESLYCTFLRNVVHPFGRWPAGSNDSTMPLHIDGTLNLQTHTTTRHMALLRELCLMVIVTQHLSNSQPPNEPPPLTEPTENEAAVASISCLANFRCRRVLLHTYLLLKRILTLYYLHHFPYDIRIAMAFMRVVLTFDSAKRTVYNQRTHTSFALMRKLDSIHPSVAHTS